MRRPDRFLLLQRRWLWERVDDGGPGRRALIRTVRIFALVVDDLMAGELTLRAMSLVYTTLLSLAPLLAFSFSILKGFGAHNQLQGALTSYLAPLGPTHAQEIAARLVGFVDNLNVTVLGALGLAVLVYTVVALLQKVESAFNYVWGVARNRSLGVRFSTFVSALTVGPLLVFSALALTGAIVSDGLGDFFASIPGVGATIEWLLSLVPFLLVVAAFTFLYAFIPNTRVTVGAAATGGAVAGLLWEAVGLAFASFAANATNYEAVYATFASVILFLIWMYLSWLILLVGARICVYRQHPRLVAAGPTRIRFSTEQLEAYALALLAAVGRAFYAGDRAPSANELAAHLALPTPALEAVTAPLLGEGFIAVADTGFLPAVPLETTTVADVVTALRRYQPERSYPSSGPDDPMADEMARKVSDAIHEATSSTTLKALCSNPSP